MGFELTINGRTVAVGDLPSTTTLADFLRSSGLTGTKIGCAEGDCGACTVALVEADAHGRPTYRAINSCIALLPMFAGREIVTVEGISREGAPLHPVQQAMVSNYGSQCGYCTPGFVVSLFEGFHRPNMTAPDWSDQLCGNLCRCTGYRPIRDAALDATKSRADKANPERVPEVAPILGFEHHSATDRFFRPTSLDRLFELLAAHPDAHLIAGATEIGVEVTKKHQSFPTLISTDGIPLLRQIHSTGDAWWIGGAATLTAIEETVAPSIPALAKMLRVFASRQIRSRATLGGNLVTASPIGDSAPLLLALDARVHLASARHSRVVPLENFFTGYRKTALEPGEILLAVEIPRTSEGGADTAARRSDFLKVSKRRELDIAIVAGAFVVELDPAGIVRHARIAYGGVAATPVRARRAEAALVGRSFSESVDEIAAILESEFTPIDDVRALADYRRGLVSSLYRKFVSGETSEAVDGDLDFAHGPSWVIDDASRSRPARKRRRPRHRPRALRRRRRPTARHAGRLAGAFTPRARPHHAPRRRRVLGRCRASSPSSSPRTSRGTTTSASLAHDEPLLATERSVLPRPTRRAGGRRVDPRLPRRRGPGRGRLRAAAAASRTPRRDRGEELPHRARTSSASRRLRRRLATAPQRFSGRVRDRRPGALLPRDPRRLGRAAARTARSSSRSSTQHPSEIQTIVAEVLGLPRQQVIVQSPRMGGGFGGKETQGNAFAALVALAALQTGRAGAVAARPRPRHDRSPASAIRSMRASTSATTTTAASSRSMSSSSPTAAGRSISRRRSSIAPSSTSTTPTTCPRVRRRRSRREDQRHLATPRFAASADRRGCW